MDEENFNRYLLYAGRGAPTTAETVKSLQANAWKNTNSDGTINVQMVSANTNNIVSILNSGFTGNENLTPYLMGVKLTEDQLGGYVNVTSLDLINKLAVLLQ